MAKGRPKRLKLEERIALARRYHAGETPKVLAEAYGVSRRHVTRLAKEERGEGVEIRDPSVAVSFRAAQSELNAFDAEWQARGFVTRSQALQALVRARCGLVDVARADFERFGDTLRRAQDVSDAGRVLAKAVQRGKLALEPEDRAVLLALLDLAEKTRRRLATMQATARSRRGQGWQPVDAEDLETSAVAVLAGPSRLNAPCQSLPPGRPEDHPATEGSEPEVRTAQDA